MITRKNVKTFTGSIRAGMNGDITTLDTWVSIDDFDALIIERDKLLEENTRLKNEAGPCKCGICSECVTRNWRRDTIGDQPQWPED